MSFHVQSALERLAESLALELDCLLDAINAGRQPKDEANQLKFDLERMTELARLSESRSRGLWDTIPSAVMVLDQSGRIMDGNLAASKLLGYSPEDLRRRTVFDLNPSLPLDHMGNVQRRMSFDNVDVVETENRHADGHLIQVEVRSALLEDQGQIRVVAVVHELSRQNLNREALQKSESLLREMLNSLDHGIVIQDKSLQTLLVNNAAKRILEPLGVSAEFAEADFARVRVCDASGRAIAWNDRPQAVALRTRVAIESTMLGLISAQSHRMIWLKMAVYPKLDPITGEVRQVISAFSDVTELKRSAELFDEAQRLGNAAGFEYDMVDGTVFLTEQGYRMFGLVAANKAVEGGSLLALIRGHDRERALSVLRQAIRDRQPVDVELRVTLSGSQPGWVRVLARPHVSDDTLLRFTGVVRDVTAQKLEEERLKRRAEQDTLTGLANRDSFLRSLRGAIDAASLAHGPAVVFVDLDRFKVLNDLLGHAAGDRLISACGQRLRNNVPASCLVARIGADEFAALLPEVRSDDLLTQIAERIHRAFQRPFVDRGEDFLITASIGLARYPNQGKIAEDLLRHADAAMQEAKRRGRNRWQTFSADLANTLKRELLIETQLRKALENHELRVVYQPKLDLQSGRVVGAEALLRWNSKVLGEMSPDIFIPHAETTGDIVQIGNFVLRESCRQLGDWRRSGLKLDHIAVNISYRQFLSDRFEGDVADALLDQGLDGSSLELELTERALIEDSPEVNATMDALHRLGVRLCIDDFGEGYSALGLLRRFPVQGLKISNKFMQGIPINPVDSRLCEVIVQMARALNVRVTAEGVETQQQWQFLSALGAEYGQGFLFARPLEVNDFEAFLRANDTG